MPIEHYEIVDPPTSAEVETRFFDGFQEGVALRGLLEVTVSSKNHLTALDEILRISIRHADFTDFGRLSSVLGRGTLNLGTEVSRHSDSVKISLSPQNENEPARASIVLT